jgi:hypothetical protein
MIPPQLWRRLELPGRPEAQPDDDLGKLGNWSTAVMATAYGELALFVVASSDREDDRGRSQLPPGAADMSRMRTSKRQAHSRKQHGEWGVVEIAWHGGDLWTAYWIELSEPGRISIEMDPDRNQNITQVTWGRARRAFGVPERIVVLDEVTAARVRRAVPSRIPVVIEPDHPRLRAEMDVVPRDKPAVSWPDPSFF